MSITAANSSFVLGVTNLFPVAQVMQGYDVDEAFAADDIAVGETKMGVDGIMSYGFVFEAVPLHVALQADSPSINFFESWYTAELAAKDKFQAFATIRYPSVNRTYAFTNGALVNYSPMSSAKKILMPRRFVIHFQKVVGVPI
jgi:hypothetical protein